MQPARDAYIAALKLAPAHLGARVALRRTCSWLVNRSGDPHAPVRSRHADAARRASSRTSTASAARSGGADAPAAEHPSSGAGEPDADRESRVFHHRRHLLQSGQRSRTRVPGQHVVKVNVDQFCPPFGGTNTGARATYSALDTGSRTAPSLMSSPVTVFFDCCPCRPHRPRRRRRSRASASSIWLTANPDFPFTVNCSFFIVYRHRHLLVCAPGDVTGPVPAFVVVPVSVLEKGDKGADGARLPDDRLYGYVAFNIDYRLVQNDATTFPNPNAVSTFPDPLVDVQLAVRWVRYHAAGAASDLTSVPRSAATRPARRSRPSSACSARSLRSKPQGSIRTSRRRWVA